MFKIPKNIKPIIDKACEQVGLSAADGFSVSVFCYIVEQIESPIEQAMYVGLRSVIFFNYLEGITINHQSRIGKYRADFQVSFNGRSVFVECDSQQFHEKTQEERRHEKERDRFFQKENHKIFHYTGAEILKDPFEVAREMLAYVTKKDEEDMLKDSNYGVD